MARAWAIMAGVFSLMGCQGARPPPHDEKNDVVIVLSPPLADASVTPAVAIDASEVADSSSVDASKPLSAHCKKLAADYLVISPENGTACDSTACGKAGGECAYAGFCFGGACIRKAKDGNRACTDGSQCESNACVAAAGAKPGPGDGKCSTVALTLGCHVMVNRGRVSSGALCGD